MDPVLTTLPTLFVTAIFYCWTVYHRDRLRRYRVLRERIAYMLWTAAQHGGDGSRPVALPPINEDGADRGRVGPPRVNSHDLSSL